MEFTRWYGLKMEKTKVAVSLLLAVLPVVGMAESVAEGEQPVETPMRYFVGLKGGLSQISNSDRVVLASGKKLKASTTDHEGFAGFDFGVYTPGGQSRAYYSFERHTSETRFSDPALGNSSGKGSYETKANLHLLSADRLFRHHDDVTPFVGLHIGYANIEPESRFPDNFKVSGIVFGVQAGIGWNVMEDMGLELGMRHTVLPSDIKSWNGEDSQGNRVTFESQQNGVTSFYAGASYRF